MSRSVLLPALLALAACNASPPADPADQTGSIDSELASQVRYIVGFKADQAPGRAALASAGAKVVLDLPSVNAAAITLPARAVAALQGNPAFEYIEEDAPRYPMAQTIPYGITMAQADQVWAAGTTGGLKVCVIDSGVYTAHEDLAGISLTGYASGTGTWNSDGCGHGTHVTGTIAARDNTLGVVGMIKGAISIHMIKVFGDTCAWTYTSTLTDAAARCQSAGAKVVSMSLGGGAKSRTEENQFKNMWNAGIISVAAAGNDGTTRLSYPASYPIVISVAAVDSTRTVATFSQHNSAVDIAAPGVGVLSTVPWNATASIAVGASTYNGTVIEGTPSTSSAGVSGGVVDGGLCGAAGSWAGKVVLCQRGTYTFAEKVTAVQNGGGVAAVIYNNVSGGFSGTMNGAPASIPGIGISMEDGQALMASALGQSGTVKSFTTNPASGYEAWDGTSMATPHVSGAIALIWSAYPTKTATQVRAAIENSALDLGTAGVDTYYGKGLLQAKAALDYLATH